MPDGVNIPGGPSFAGNPKPPDVPCDPIGDAWRGPQGPPGVDGVGGLPLEGGQLSGPLNLPNGTLATPSLQIGAADGTGLSRAGANISVGIQGALSASFFANSMQSYGQLYMLNNKIVQLADATAATDALNMRTADARYLARAGGTLSGPLMLPAGTVAAPGLTLGTNSSGIYGQGSATAISAIGTQVISFGLGGNTSFVSLNMNNNRIIGLTDATAATDALNMRTADARYAPAALADEVAALRAEVQSLQTRLREG
jgi:hypothetical protein